MQTLFTLHNEHLQATFSTQGAELQSLTDRKTGQEYCWQGDLAFWNGRAPILFPIVGGMWDGACRINGQVYHIPKHGFVRKREWTRIAAAQHLTNDNSITFAVENTSEELEMFPWPYRLEVTYALTGRTLRTDLRVKNLSSASTLYFQMGGHPSLRLPDWQPEGQNVQGYLRFEGRPLDLLRASLQGCTEPKRVPIPWNDDVETSNALARHQPANALVPISVATFANEALIFDHRQLSAVEVLNLRKQRVARFASSAPVWLVWAPQGKHAPFLCVEPWYGLCDPQDFHGNIEERPYIQHAAPGAVWEGWYTMEV